MRIDDVVVDIRSRTMPSVEPSNEEIRAWLKRRFHQATSLIARYNPKKFRRVTEFAVMNDVSEYKLPADFRKMLRVSLMRFSPEDNKLYAQDIEGLTSDEIIDLEGDNQYADGAIRYYVEGGNIGITPKATINMINSIRYRYSYEPQFVQEEFDKLPTDIQMTLSDGVVVDCLSQDDNYSAAADQRSAYEKNLKQLCMEFARDVVDGPKNLIRDDVRHHLGGRRRALGNMGANPWRY